MAENEGFLTGIGGNSQKKKLTTENVISNLLPAALSCGINAGGGALARLVGHKIDGWKAGYGTLGTGMLAVFMKAVVQPTSDNNIAIREVAAGMAGYVGDEVVDSVVLFWRSEAWKAGKVWTKGVLVRHAGGYWQATADLDASGTEPGKDDRWLRQSQMLYSAADMKECARLLLGDKDRLAGISQFITNQIAPKILLNDEQKVNTAKAINDALQQVGDSIARMKAPQ